MPTDRNPIRFFTVKDADPCALEDQRIAVLGYGHLGRPLALNLRDSKLRNLVVGNIEDEYAAQARQDGFQVLPIADAVAEADVSLLLLPDEVIPEIFDADIAPNLQPGSAIVLASGYTLAYGLIAPPDGSDILLLAPRMAGENARQRFLRKEGFFAYVSVESDASGRAWPRLLGLADAVGVLQAGALELDARREADIDLFIEQTMGAIIGVAVMQAFAIGEDAGIPPEALVLEMYMSGEMEMVFRSFRKEGFFKASSVHGPTALYGGFIRTMQFMGSGLGTAFQRVLEEIQSGEFARGFQAERQAGYSILSQAEAMSMEDSPIAQAERRVREMLLRDRQHP
ncbi:MAG: NAD(P)-binding domain-containing protein [Anaerolineae bacterium]|jgi:ketol-acid reductoisomerase